MSSKVSNINFSKNYLYLNKKAINYRYLNNFSSIIIRYKGGAENHGIRLLTIAKAIVDKTFHVFSIILIVYEPNIFLALIYLDLEHSYYYRVYVA